MYYWPAGTSLPAFSLNKPLILDCLQKVQSHEKFSCIYYRITKKSFALFKKIELDDNI